MARSNPLTILLERSGDQDIHEAPAAATGTIYPGMLVKWASSAGSLIPCNQDNMQEIKVAVENPYRSGATDRAAIDAHYENGDRVRFVYARRGDLLYMLLEGDQTATALRSYVYSYGSTGDDGKLACTGAGTYPPLGDGGTYTFGLAESAKIAGSGAGTRVKVRVY